MQSKSYQLQDLLVTVTRLSDEPCPQNTCLDDDTCVDDTHCKTNTKISLTAADFSPDSLLGTAMAKLRGIEENLEE